MYRLICLIIISILVSSCDNDNKQVYNGYIDADLVYLSANFDGRLEGLSVNRGDAVKPNQMLFYLEEATQSYEVGKDTMYTQDLLKQRLQTVSNIHFSQLQLHRAQVMRKSNAASQESVDSAINTLEVYKQQLASIDAKIKRSRISKRENEWRIKRKKGIAPKPGIVFDLYYFKGEYVPTGSPVLSLITPDRLKVVFFVPESELRKIKLNQAIEIRADNAPTLAKAQISYISSIAEYTAPIIYSREERQRLVFRVEAKVTFPELEKVHLGQPVDVKL